MLRYIIRRLFLMIPLVLGITLISFGTMKLAPGDYFEHLKENPAIKASTIVRLRKDFGLDKPPVYQYAFWLRNIVLRHDFGESFEYHEPVFTLLKSRVYYTVLLSFWAMIISWSVSIPLGVYIATHRNGWVDRVVNFGAFAGISMPGFFMALLAMLFAWKSGLFPIGGATSDNYDSLTRWGKIYDTGHHLFLPLMVLSTGGVAGLMRQMRGNLLDVLGENYILAARARGLANRKVVWKHAVRNAINPLVTLIGFELTGLLSGAALVENVMSWPGLGRMLLEAVQNQDLYVAMGSFVVGAFLLILGNLIADILLCIVDPRIKVQ